MKGRMREKEQRKSNQNFHARELRKRLLPALTIEKMAPQIARKGVKASNSSVSRQSLTNPMMNPPKKVAIHWTKRATLSPMPS